MTCFFKNPNWDGSVVIELDAIPRVGEIVGLSNELTLSYRSVNIGDIFGSYVVKRVSHWLCSNEEHSVFIDVEFDPNSDAKDFGHVRRRLEQTP